MLTVKMNSFWETPRTIESVKSCLTTIEENSEASKVFPALGWLAAMCFHIPNRGEQMVRYY